MRQNWAMFQRAFSQEQCKSLVGELLQLEPSDGTTFSDTGTEYRRSQIRWVDDHPVIDAIYKKVVHANLHSFNVDVENFHECQFTEYKASYRGRYDWHHDIDHSSGLMSDRKLSVVVQLSDSGDYEGGNFEFDDVPNPNPDHLRSQGTILIFPSYLRHKVEDITKGTRYSLVLWFHGPRWR